MVVVMMELPHQVFGYDQVSLLVVNDCHSQCTRENLKKLKQKKKSEKLKNNPRVFYC